MHATQRCANHIWTINRDATQWNDISDKKLYAMSSSCDKEEYHPPTKRVSSSVPMSLMHLAEANSQIPESVVKRQVNLFANFVKNIAKRTISYQKFRDSAAYENFLQNDDLPSASGIAAKSTPTVDEYEYTDEELGGPYRKHRKYY